MSVLISTVFAHFLLGEFVAIPDWFGYAEHFFIGGVMTAWAIVAVLEWLRGQAYLETIIGCCSILAIAWEIFEYWCFQRAANNFGYYGDTIWDFQMNFLGTLIIALVYCRKHSNLTT